MRWERGSDDGTIDVADGAYASVCYIYKQIHSLTFLKIQGVFSETVDMKPEYQNSYWASKNSCLRLLLQLRNIDRLFVMSAGNNSCFTTDVV